MKTILKLSLIILIAMTSMATYASDDNSNLFINVKNGSGKEIRFAINKVQKANVTIKDEFDNVIYTEVVTGKEGILKTYSLEEFPEGTYYLEIVSNSKKAIHEIVVSKNTSTLSKKSVTNL